MASIRDRLITGAKPRIDAGEITQKEVEEIWEQIETFAGYGFCIQWDTVVETPDGYRMLSELKVGDKVKTPSCLGGEFANVSAIWDQGEKEVYEVTLESGKLIGCTMDHKFLCGDGEIRPLKEILEGGYTITCEE
jgi:intein/homing endonuclease